MRVYGQKKGSEGDKPAPLIQLAYMSTTCSYAARTDCSREATQLRREYYLFVVIAHDGSLVHVLGPESCQSAAVYGDSGRGKMR